MKGLNNSVKAQILTDVKSCIKIEMLINMIILSLRVDKLTHLSKLKLVLTLCNFGKQVQSPASRVIASGLNCQNQAQQDQDGTWKISRLLNGVWHVCSSFTPAPESCGSWGIYTDHVSVQWVVLHSWSSSVMWLIGFGGVKILISYKE